MEKEKEQTESHIGIVNLERRKYPRFTVNLPIEYHRLDSSTRYTGRVLNASEGGLLLYLPEQMEMGQDLKIKLFFTSGGELNTVELLAQVVWTDIHLGKGWGDYRTGVMFTDISSENLNQLKNFLRSLSQ
ncbi:MAG: PilZ domain-containing protein [Desulfobacterales bacterium]|nr:PilZ domain-containing protein [Desulfobacterales bacterium]